MAEPREGEGEQNGELYTWYRKLLLFHFRIAELHMCVYLIFFLILGTDPYDVFSPESRNSVLLASEAIVRSREIRRELRAAIDNKRTQQLSAHSTVNEGLTRKIAETVTLTVGYFTEFGSISMG